MTIGYKYKKTQLGLYVLCFMAISPAFANQSKFNPRNADIVLQIGGFNATQGNSQHVNIAGLIGDQFNVTHYNDQNFLVGLGYFVDGLNKNRVSLLYGINAYYLANTMVKGNIVQEQLFTNLAYHYFITNYPIYVAAKVLIHTNSNKYNVTFDMGLGPNIIQTNNFSESSLDGGITIPDHAFSGQARVAFSATAGMGIEFKHLLGRASLELSYRFFYLGQGYLNKENNQLTNALNTGNSYANALIVSVHI